MHQWQPPTASQAELRELIGHRATLVRQRSALAQAASHNKVLSCLDAPVLKALQERLQNDHELELSLSWRLQRRSTTP